MIITVIAYIERQDCNCVQYCCYKIITEVPRCMTLMISVAILFDSILLSFPTAGVRPLHTYKLHV